MDVLLPPESRGAELTIAQTDLCPALVIRARTNALRLFCDLDAWGLGGPTHLAIPMAEASPTVLAQAAAIDGSEMSEPWLLAWFEGAPGWNNLRYGQPCHWRGRHPEKPYPHVDVPWLVVLQRKARRLGLKEDGLSLVFEDNAGIVVLMPLYGTDLKLAEETRSWETRLPKNVTERCRRWSRYLRRIPIDSREEFRIDETADRVRVCQTFDYLEINDYWHTEPKTIAPYPPFVRAAHKYGMTEIQLEALTSEPSESIPAEEDEVATPAGPHFFRLNVPTSSYEISSVLRYITKEEVYPGEPTDAAAQRAIARLQDQLGDDPRLPVKTSGGFSRGLALALTSYARALPYLGGGQRDAIRQIMEDLVEDLLDPSRYVSTIRYSTASDVEPVGEAICQRTRDAYKVVQANFFGLWAAANATGDWERIRDAWPLIRRWFQLPFQTQWLSPLPPKWEGLDIARAVFDGTIGFARIAAELGETEDYGRACGLFAKVCAGWFAMEMMPDYYRENSPGLVNTDSEFLIWHPCRINGYVAIANDHLMPNDDPQIDSRGWASAYGRQTPSTARFWRDCLREHADGLLHKLLPHSRPDWAEAGAPVVWRAYVLNESAEQIEQYRAKNDTVDAENASDQFRRRTYRLFQSIPILSQIATIEAGSEPKQVDAVPATDRVVESMEGASRTAERIDHAPIPCRIASAEEAGGHPLLYWPGIRTPKQPFPVCDKRLDVLPFGSIRLDEPDRSAEGFEKTEIAHPNWCLSLFAHYRQRASRQVHRSSIETLPADRVNRAFGCIAYAAKPFPFKEYKFAADRDQWLAEYHKREPAWQRLLPPHELTNGLGVRPGVEPWIRHSEPDPKYRHWVAVDLGRRRLVDEVVVAFEPDWVSSGFRIEAETRDDDWSASFAEPESPIWRDRLAEQKRNSEAISHNRFEPRRIRWVRVIFTHAAPVGLEANRLILWEIEIHGPADAPADKTA